MSKEAMKLALEALERVDAIERGMVTTSRHHYQAKENTTKAITALREALAEQPAQRKPLTDEEIASIYMNHTDRPLHAQWNFARAIEAAHGIKE